MCRNAVGTRAEVVERLNQIVRDVVGRPALDLPALEHEDNIAVFHEGDLRRGRGVAGEVAASARGRVRILTRENRREMVGLPFVLQRDRHRGPSHPRRTAADGVHDNERGSLGVLELRVDLIRRAKLFDAKLRELLAHRGDEAFVVHRGVSQIPHFVVTSR